MNGVELIDDGTLDTVFQCADCGERFRYSFVHDEFEDLEEFRAWALADAQSQHDDEGCIPKEGA